MAKEKLPSNEVDFAILPITTTLKIVRPLENDTVKINPYKTDILDIHSDLRELAKKNQASAIIESNTIQINPDKTDIFNTHSDLRRLAEQRKAA